MLLSSQLLVFSSVYNFAVDDFLNVCIQHAENYFPFSRHRPWGNALFYCMCAFRMKFSLTCKTQTNGPASGAMWAAECYHRNVNPIMICYQCGTEGSA